jgi:hypothetical protein
MSQRSSIPYVFVAIILSAGVAVAAFSALIVVGMGFCGGDGGSPYAAPLSPRGQACGVADALMPILAIASIVITFVGGVACARSRRAAIALVAAAVSVGVLLAPVAILSALSPNCAGGESTSIGCDSY